MAYKKHRIAALIEAAPQVAREEITSAYTEAKASQRDAAVRLGVAESTLIRWVKILNLHGALAAIKKTAKKEGWHHDNNEHGGRPTVKKQKKVA